MAEHGLAFLACFWRFWHHTRRSKNDRVFPDLTVLYLILLVLGHSFSTISVRADFVSKEGGHRTPSPRIFDLCRIQTHYFCQGECCIGFCIDRNLPPKQVTEANTKQSTNTRQNLAAAAEEIGSLLWRYTRSRSPKNGTDPQHAALIDVSGWGPNVLSKAEREAIRKVIDREKLLSLRDMLLEYARTRAFVSMQLQGQMAALLIDELLDAIETDEEKSLGTGIRIVISQQGECPSYLRPLPLSGNNPESLDTFLREEGAPGFFVNTRRKCARGLLLKDILMDPKGRPDANPRIVLMNSSPESEDLYETPRA